MRSKLTAAATLATGLIFATSGWAVPILLASYDYHIEGGGASSNPISTPWEIAFILQLAPPGWESYPQTRALGGNVFWGEGESGTISFTSQGSEEFTELAAYATNGTPDDFMLWALDHDGGGTGLRRSEQHILQGTPDLHGYDLQSIALTVDYIHFEPFAPLPGLVGYSYVANFNWSFFGTPVPEPTTLLLMSVAWSVASATSRGRKAEAGSRFVFVVP